MFEFFKEKYINKDFVDSHRWRILFTLIAFILTVLLLTIGFFKTLLLILLTTIGFLLGQAKDRGVNIREYIDSILK